MMNVTSTFSVAFLRVFFHGVAAYWGIQCVDLKQSIDLFDRVVFNQTYPIPDLICKSSRRRCYASNATHAVVSQTVALNGQEIPLKRWYPVDRVPGDGRWPYCLGGGGIKYSGANLTATCGPFGRCLDVCFSDDDSTPSTTVWCYNSSVKVSVKWDEVTNDLRWKPWTQGHPRDDVSRVIELDQPLVVNRATGIATIGRQGSQWVVSRGDEICVIPLQWTNGSCHVLLHGVCYRFDLEASVRCTNLTPFPPGAVVALIWTPRLVRSSIQPFEPETTYLFCLETTYHDPQRFLVCLERFYPMARKGMSLLSPFSFDGRTTTVLVRVAPIKRYGPKQKLGVTQWGSFTISFALGIVIFVLVTTTASGVSSLFNIVETHIDSIVRELKLIH